MLCYTIYAIQYCTVLSLSIYTVYIYMPTIHIVTGVIIQGPMNYPLRLCVFPHSARETRGRNIGVYIDDPCARSFFWGGGGIFKVNRN